MLFLLTVLPYLALQVLAGVRCRGGWRVLALLPLAWMVPVAVVSVNALRANSNLWPILLIPASLLTALYLAGVFAWHERRRQSRPEGRGFGVEPPLGERRDEHPG